MNRLKKADKYSIFQTFTRSHLVFTLRALEREDIRNCVDFLVEAHKAHNPLLLCLDVDPLVYRDYLEAVMNEIVADGLCLVLLDRDNRKIAGVLLCCEAANHPSFVLDSKSSFAKTSDLKPFLEILWQFPKETKTALSHKMTSHSAYILNVTIRCEYHRFDLTQKLINFVLFEHPNYLKFNWICMDSLSTHTQDLGFKLNDTLKSQYFQVVQQTDIRFWTNNEGQRPFINLKEKLAQQHIGAEHAALSNICWKGPALRAKL